MVWNAARSEETLKSQILELLEKQMEEHQVFAVQMEAKLSEERAGRVAAEAQLQERNSIIEGFRDFRQRTNKRLAEQDAIIGKLQRVHT